MLLTFTVYIVDIKVTLHCCLTGSVWLSRYSDSLRVRRSGDRNPVVARISAPVQIGLGDHLSSCTLDNGSFPGVKRPGRGVDHPPPSCAKVELYPCSPSGPQAVCYRVKLYLYICLVTCTELYPVQSLFMHH